MTARFRVHLTQIGAQDELAVLWHFMCLERGVTPAGVAAGTQSLDRRFVRGVDLGPVLPGVTRAASQMLVPTLGLGAVVLHNRNHERFNGHTLRVGLRNVTLATSAGDAVERDGLDSNLRDAVDAWLAR